MQEVRDFAERKGHLDEQLAAARAELARQHKEHEEALCSLERHTVQVRRPGMPLGEDPPELLGKLCCCFPGWHRKAVPQCLASSAVQRSVRAYSYRLMSMRRESR